jgi:hypothetical protein
MRNMQKSILVSFGLLIGFFVIVTAIGANKNAMEENVLRPSVAPKTEQKAPLGNEAGVMQGFAPVREAFSESSRYSELEGEEEEVDDYEE